MSNEDTTDIETESKKQAKHNGRKVSKSKKKDSKNKIMIFNNTNKES